MRAPKPLALALASALLVPPVLLLAGPAAGAVEVGSPAAFVSAFEDDTVTEIVLTADLALTEEPVRPLGAPALVIEGAGHTITAAPASRVLSSFNPVGMLTVRDATITGGNPAGGQGAGIAWGGPVFVEDSTITDNHAGLDGGGIYATEVARLDRSVVSGNSAGGQGSAVYVQEGDIALIDSEASENTDPSPGDGQAMALYAHRNTEAGAGDVVVIGSSVEDNSGRGVGASSEATVSRSAINGNGGEGVVADDQIQIIESTIHGNSGPGVLGDGDVAAIFSTITGNDVGIRLGPDQLYLVATVIGEQAGAACDLHAETTVASQGWNVADDLTCGLDDPTDRAEAGLDLGLGALALNGGPTRNRLPEVDSPLLDLVAGDLCTGQATDQRGVSRPQGDACEVGAVELAAADLPTDPPVVPEEPEAPSGPAAPGAPAAPSTPGTPPAPAARAVTAAPTFTG